MAQEYPTTDPLKTTDDESVPIRTCLRNPTQLNDRSRFLCEWVEKGLNPLGEGDELYQSVSNIVDAPKDIRRRQLICYFGELPTSKIQ